MSETHDQEFAREYDHNYWWDLGWTVAGQRHTSNWTVQELERGDDRPPQPTERRGREAEPASRRISGDAEAEEEEHELVEYLENLSSDVPEIRGRRIVVEEPETRDRRIVVDPSVPLQMEAFNAGWHARDRARPEPTPVVRPSTTAERARLAAQRLQESDPRPRKRRRTRDLEQGDEPAQHGAGSSGSNTRQVQTQVDEDRTVSFPFQVGDFLEIEQVTENHLGTRMVCSTVGTGGRPVQLFLDLLACRLAWASDEAATDAAEKQEPTLLNFAAWRRRVPAQDEQNFASMLDEKQRAISLSSHSLGRASQGH